MKLASIELYELRVPLKKPFTRSMPSLRRTLASLRS